jgi:hypothetical protein
MTLLLRLYLGLSVLLAPLWRAHLHRRIRHGKEDPARLAERLGTASARRPDGPLLWVHALSVGEGGAMLAPLRALRAERLLRPRPEPGIVGMEMHGHVELACELRGRPQVVEVRVGEQDGHRAETDAVEELRDGPCTTLPRVDDDGLPRGAVAEHHAVRRPGPEPRRLEHRPGSSRVRPERHETSSRSPAGASTPPFGRGTTR